jgi:hypothetical protein
MIKRALLLLALSICGSAFAQQPNQRVMSLITQDKNGLFIVMLIATPDEVRASANQLAVGAGEPKPVRYPRELFDELWLEAKSLGLAEFISKGDSAPDADVGASRNYIISIGNGPDGETYLVPKCSATPAIVSFVRRLANGLLPAGSPGLYEPCPEATNSNDG